MTPEPLLTDPTYHLKTTAQLQQAYDRIFTQRPVKRADPHYRWILGLLKPRPGNHLLDVACGAGFLLQEAKPYSLHLSGVELSSEAIQLAQKHAPQAKIIQADGEKLPFRSDHFDYVTCLGSLEHYLHPEQGLAEIRRVLKPGGMACLMVPNRYSWYILRQVIATGQPPTEQTGFERLATMKEWKELIESQNLKVLRVVKQNEIKRLIDWERRRIRSVSKYLSSLATRLLCPFHLAYHFVFLCTK